MQIIVWFQETPEGKAALDAAVTEARVHDGTLTLVAHARVDATDPAQLHEAVQQSAAQINAAGVPCEAEWSVGAETAASQVLNLAEARRADLVVIGLRRRSPVGKLIMGSDAQSILLSADVPVLAVKHS